MRCRRVALWVGAGMVACGGGGEPPPSKSPAAVTVVSEEPDVAPEPLPVTVVDLVGRDGDVFVHFDAKAFRAGTLYQAIMNVVNSVPLVRDQLADLTQTCGFNPVEALAEVGFSARVRRRDLDMDTAVLAARSSQSPQASLECIRRLIPEFKRTEVAGYPALDMADGYVVAAEPFVVLGEHQPVRRALGRLANGANQRVPPGFLYAELESAEMFEAERIVIGLGQGPKGTEFEVHARATSVEQAQDLERSVLEMRREGLEEIQEAELEPAVKNLATSLVESVMFERRGADLVGAFDFGSPERETQILGLGTAMVVQAIERYLRMSKVMEARRAMYVIASSLREYAANQNPPRFPASAPLVPPQVPAGSRYQSVEADWQQAGWKEIGFSWSPPQYYAFGFDTARGGRKVTVRALGDLDGDGQPAKFELDLELKGGQITGESETIREEQPDE
ncbi:MAG TPA: hypothetical protein VI197_17000 [Polyangiaceae bacterium]